MMLEPNRCGRVAKLVHRDGQTSGSMDPLRYLTAERLGVLVSSRFAGEQPEIIRTAQQRWPEVVHIFIDERRELIVELKLQINAVLYVIVWKHQHIRRIDPAWLNEIFVEPDLGQIAEANWGVCNDGDGDRELGGHGSFDGRLLLLQARLSHQGCGKVDHFDPTSPLSTCRTRA